MAGNFRDIRNSFFESEPVPTGRTGTSRITNLYIPREAVVRVAHVVINKSTGATVADNVEVADSVWKRFKGLMGRRIRSNQGLFIVPCNGIHMFFMRMAIDAVFVDRGNKVVRVVRELQPWRMVPYVRGAHAVLELYPGAAKTVNVGDVLCRE